MGDPSGKRCEVVCVCMRREEKEAVGVIVSAKVEMLVALPVQVCGGVGAARLTRNIMQKAIVFTVTEGSPWARDPVTAREVGCLGSMRTAKSKSCFVFGEAGKMYRMASTRSNRPLKVARTPVPTVDWARGKVPVWIW